MSAHSYIACDLGAESGRVILGRLDSGRLALEEIHRFPNGATNVLGSLRWDLLRIFDELKAGLKKIGARRDATVASLSVDSWGVDYALFSEGQPLLGIPYHYRDARTEGPYARVMQSALPEKIFRETGIQFMAINTLYHFMAENEDGLFEMAGQFLNIADYLQYLFSGVARAEESLASTTQMYNPATRSWSAALIDEFRLPAPVFPTLVPSGTTLGPLLPEIAAETGLGGVDVIATCSHDTGAAVAAVPAQGGEDWAYLSSGTWSLIGVELPAPLISEKVRAHNYTNEAGHGGTTRFLKNIAGLWILQECRRAWVAEGGDFDYAALNLLAVEAEPLRSLINPFAERFVKPGGMPRKVAGYCKETAQPEPETPGQFTRCIFESLALAYRQCLDEIEMLTGRNIRTLHIIGGGSQSALLNQYAASAAGRTVLAGPVEATAIGNLLLQAIALGHLSSLDALRQTVRASFPVQTFEPLDPDLWKAARARFAGLPR